MNPTSLRGLARVLALALPPAFALTFVPASAGVAQTRVDLEAGPFVGGAMFLSGPSSEVRISRQEAPPLVLQEGELRSAVSVGVHAGVRFAEKVGLEGTYAWVPTRLTARRGLEAHGGAVDANSIRYALLTSWHFPAQGRVQPFAAAGFSGETLSFGPYLSWERRTSSAGTVAAGATYALADGLALRLQAARDVLTGAERAPRNQLMLSAGLNARQRMR